MRIELRWRNGLWLMVPLLAWNLVLGPRIVDERIISDAYSPQWLLLLENITRLGVFILPLFIPLELNDRRSKTGLLLYITGTLLYFASWLPLLMAPQSVRSTSPIGLLAPRLTPVIPFLGIALIGRWWLYAGLALAFISFHTWHGVQNL